MYLEKLPLTGFCYLLFINRDMLLPVHLLLESWLLFTDLVQCIPVFGYRRFSAVAGITQKWEFPFFGTLSSKGIEIRIKSNDGATISSTGFGVIKCSMLFSWSKSRLGVILYLPNERLTAERIMAYIDFSSWYLISVFVG